MTESNDDSVDKTLRDCIAREQLPWDIAITASQVIVMTPAKQLEFWTALHETPKLTLAQKKLAAVMRGEA